MDVLSIAGFALNVYSYFQEHPLEVESAVAPQAVEERVVLNHQTQPYPVRKIPVSELLEGHVSPQMAEQEAPNEALPVQEEQRVAQAIPKRFNKKLLISKKRHQSESGVDLNGHYFLRRKTVEPSE